MNSLLLDVVAAACCVLPANGLPQSGAREPGLAGERLAPTALGVGVVETMDAVLARARRRPAEGADVDWQRNGAQGVWVVPPRSATGQAHSGEHYAINRWGDTRMGIGFPEPVDVKGAWIAGQAARGTWTDGIQAVGYRRGEEVGRTDWHEDIGATPSWFAMDLVGVDRIELLARAVLDGGGWYALDDLTYELAVGGSQERRTVVVDFDDLSWSTVLTGSEYAGLIWETGTGSFEDGTRSIHAPIVPRGSIEPSTGEGELASSSGPGTLPEVRSEFAGMRMFETGTGYIPPDTCGAVGPAHFVSVVNVKLGVFDKASGNQLLGVPLEDFFATQGLGDPRVTYDPHSGRYFLLASSGPWTARIYLAISTTADPMGPWFKTYFDAAVGTDVGRWPDYPTLGVDADGFYVASLMVPSTMTIWAIEKAPLLDASPSLGAVTAWRDLPFEGAIQPCVTQGDSGGELLISRRSATVLRLRQVTGPLTAPILSVVADVSVPQNLNPPPAPALGSATDLSTGDTRPMNAVYRDGSVYTAHTIRVDGRAGCRWYQLDASTGTALQIGTIADPVRSYYYPSISVNAAGHIVLGFSGSHAGEYAGAYYTGRNALDPPNVTAAPALLQEGLGAYNHVDGNGTARWGDYSLTSVDPLDDATFWTIQEYSRSNNRWGTWIAEIAFPDPCPAPWTYCVSSQNSVGWGALIGWDGGTSIAANDLGLVCQDLPTNQSGLFFYGPQEALVFFGNGVRCVGGPLYRLPIVSTGPWGFASWDLDVEHPPQPSGQITAGSTWHFQFWYRDPMGGGAAFNLSDGLSATFCP